MMRFRWGILSLWMTCLADLSWVLWDQYLQVCIVGQFACVHWVINWEVLPIRMIAI